MFSTRKWQQRALILNLAGTALLFYSFQATSSDFKLVTAKPNPLDPALSSPAAIRGFGAGSATTDYALCVNNYTLVESDARSGVTLGHAGCPSWVDAKPAAVVNIEHPFFEGLGFISLLAGFLLQYLSIPQAQTIIDLRNQLKAAQKEKKLKDRLEAISGSNNSAG